MSDVRSSDRPGSKRLTGRLRGLRPWHLSWLVAAPIAAALAWLLLTSPIGPSGSSGLGAAPGATFYVLGAETQGLQVGQRAPDFVGSANGKEVRLTDLVGRPVRIDDFRGRPLWINFWATWCPPCQQETPDLRAAYEANRDGGFALLAISVQEPVDDVRSFVQRYGLTYDIGLDSTGAVFSTYSVFGLPTHYFVDRTGVIRDRYFGPLSRQQMDQKVARITGP
jgi:peroxiredoxin